MTASFVAYIDESGDEGFTFRPDGSGSSRWFVLSAMVVRKTNDHHIVAGAKRARQIIKYEPKKPIHFCKLRHEQRTPVARIVGELPVRTVSILIHKPSISSPVNFQSQPYSLYRYASRLLLERISWLCKANQKQGQGDGRVELVYSNRSAMSYDDLRKYIAQLHHNPGSQKVTIDWSILDEDLVRAVNHDQLAGLQLADVVASGIYQSVNPNLYGDVEEKYLELLKGTIFHGKNGCDGYGLKFWCDDQATIERICNIVKS